MEKHDITPALGDEITVKNGRYYRFPYDFTDFPKSISATFAIDGMNLKNSVLFNNFQKIFNCKFAIRLFKPQIGGRRCQINE